MARPHTSPGQRPGKMRRTIITAESPSHRPHKSPGKAWANGTGFQPFIQLLPVTQSVALGWYKAGALPLLPGVLVPVGCGSVVSLALNHRLMAVTPPA